MVMTESQAINIARFIEVSI